MLLTRRAGQSVGPLLRRNCSNDFYKKRREKEEEERERGRGEREREKRREREEGGERKGGPERRERNIGKMRIFQILFHLSNKSNVYIKLSVKIYKND